MKTDQIADVSVMKPRATEELMAKDTVNGATDNVKTVTDTVKIFHNRSNRYLIALGVLIVLGAIIYILFLNGELDTLLNALNKENHLFYWMVLVGFLAEIVAGSMGMGYGVICTTILLILNIPPPIISASIHSAESFTTAAGSISHYKFRNVNKKLTKLLAIPAIVGAVCGALLLTYVGERYAKMTKPVIAAYTMYLGFRILQNAFTKKNGSNGTRKKKTITIRTLAKKFRVTAPSSFSSSLSRSISHGA